MREDWPVLHTCLAAFGTVEGALRAVPRAATAVPGRLRAHSPEGVRSMPRPDRAVCSRFRILAVRNVFVAAVLSVPVHLLKTRAHLLAVDQRGACAWGGYYLGGKATALSRHNAITEDGGRTLKPHGRLQHAHIANDSIL
jgi:hypothetical protein